MVSKGESMRHQLDQAIYETKTAFEDLVAKVKMASTGGDPKCIPFPLPDKSDVITIDRPDDNKEYLKLGSPDDQTLFPSSETEAKEKTCGLLPQTKGMRELTLLKLISMMISLTRCMQ